MGPGEVSLMSAANTSMTGLRTRSATDARATFIRRQMFSRRKRGVTSTRGRECRDAPSWNTGIAREISTLLESSLYGSDGGILVKPLGMASFVVSMRKAEVSETDYRVVRATSAAEASA